MIFQREEAQRAREHELLMMDKQLELERIRAGLTSQTMIDPSLR